MRVRIQVIESVLQLFPPRLIKQLKAEFYGREYLLLLEEIPSSLQDVIKARPDRATKVEKRVVQCTVVCHHSDGFGVLGHFSVIRFWRTCGLCSAGFCRRASCLLRLSTTCSGSLFRMSTRSRTGRRCKTSCRRFRIRCCSSCPPSPERRCVLTNSGALCWIGVQT